MLGCKVEEFRFNLRLGFVHQARWINADSVTIRKPLSKAFTVIDSGDCASGFAEVASDMDMHREVCIPVIVKLTHCFFKRSNHLRIVHVCPDFRSSHDIKLMVEPASQTSAAP